MKDKEQLQCWLHHSMAVVGGFLGVYAILSHNDIFGNAQTVNLISLVTALVGHDIYQFLLRFGALLIYMLSVAITVVLKRKTRLNMHATAVIVDCIAVLILGLMPENMNAVIAVYPIFFAMPFQWNCFSGAYGYASSCIFSSNNVRQFSMSLTEYAITHDKTQLFKAKFFGGSLLCFYTGVAVSAVAHSFWGIHSVWLCYVLLAFSTVLTVYEIKSFE